jgi:hypothetical protein
MSEKTTDARECPRCHKQALGPWIEDNGRTLIGDRCGACNATWMLDVPQRIVDRVTDEEITAILRPSEGAAIEMLTGEMMGVRDPEGDGDHYDAYQEIAAPLVRRERALAAEVTALRAEVKRLAGENAVLADDAASAPKFVPFAGGEIS